jgi:hypothetical protein
MREGTRRFVIAIGVLVTGAAIAGCGLFFPTAFDDDGNLAQPSPIATYTRGTATVKFDDGTKITLTKLSAGPHLLTTFGSTIRWSNADGWSLLVDGAGSSLQALGAELGTIELDHISGGKHVHSYGEACDVDVGVADAKALRGTAKCIGMQWFDMLDLGYGASSNPAPEFDATITFAATR